MNNLTNHWLNFIGGNWVDAKRSTEVFDPATGEPFATIACADADDVDRAVTAARACVNSGMLTDCRPAKRAELLLRIAAEIRNIADEAAH